MPGNIPLSSQDITQHEIDEVVSVLKGDRLALGPQIEAFENACAKVADRKYGIAVNSGTSGLHLCVKAAGIKPGDEVITTPFSFIATTNCILFENAKPVFVDIDPVSYNMDPDAIEAAITPKTKAILPVEVFGNTAHFDKYEAIAKKHNLALIEDSCEAIGGVLGSRKAGSFGLCSTFAFYPNKQITTGEGGMIVTDDIEFRDMCRALRNQGRHPNDSWLEHSYMGYNYRISEITAAIGKVQVSRLDEILDKRRAVAQMYDKTFERLQAQGKIHIPSMVQKQQASYFVYVIRLADQYSQTDRDNLMQHLRDNNVGCNAYFTPIHTQKYVTKMLRTKLGDFPITEAISQRTIALPFFANMTQAQVNRVAELVTQFL